MCEFIRTAPSLIGLRKKAPKITHKLDPWQKSRILEDFRLNREAHLLEQQRCNFRSKWEEQAENNHIEAETLRRFYAIKEQEREQLEKRRDQLEQVRLAEEQEFAAQQKSPLDEISERYEQSRIKAEQLERERKEADQKLAREKYEQLFRESCDQLRGELSRRKAYEIAEDRRVQIAMKQLQRKQDLEEESYFAQLLKQYDVFTKEDVTKKTKASRFLVEQLQNQIQEKEIAKKEMEEQKRKEKENLIQLRQELQEELIKTHQHKLEQRTKIKNDLDVCLREKREKQAKEHNESLAFENLLCHLTDALEHEKDAKDKEEKERVKNEALQYLDYVRQTEREETVFEHQINKVVDEAIEREAKRINDHRLREKAARQKLTQETANVCQQQIQMKAEEFKKQVEEKRTTAVELKASIEKNRQKTLEELQNHRSRLMEYRQALEAQIATQHQFAMAVQQESEREWKAQQDTELNMKRLIQQVIKSEEKIPNRHPWRIQLDQGNLNVPQWTGTLSTST